MRFVFKETRLFGQTGVAKASVMHRRATDGILSRAAGLERLVRLARGRVARTVTLAVAAAHGRFDVRQRPAGRRGVDSRGGAAGRLSGLLLLLADGRPFVAGSGTAGARTGAASGAGAVAAGVDRDRRFAD